MSFPGSQGLLQCSPSLQHILLLHICPHLPHTHTQTLSLIKQTTHPTPSPISLPRLCPQSGVPSQVHYPLKFLIHNFLNLLWFPNEQWQHLPEHANTAVYTASVTLVSLYFSTHPKMFSESLLCASYDYCASYDFIFFILVIYLREGKSERGNGGG